MINSLYIELPLALISIIITFTIFIISCYIIIFRKKLYDDDCSALTIHMYIFTMCYGIGKKIIIIIIILIVYGDDE